MEGAEEVGRKDEAAFEDRDDEEVDIAGGGHLRRHLGIARGNRRRIVEDADVAAANDRHQRIPTATTVLPVRLNATFSPPDGLASAERKTTDPPASSSVATGFTTQE